MVAWFKEELPYIFKSNEGVICMSAVHIIFIYIFNLNTWVRWWRLHRTQMQTTILPTQAPPPPGTLAMISSYLGIVVGMAYHQPFSDNSLFPLSWLHSESVATNFQMNVGSLTKGLDYSLTSRQPFWCLTMLQRNENAHLKTKPIHCHFQRVNFTGVKKWSKINRSKMYSQQEFT